MHNSSIQSSFLFQLKIEEEEMLKNFHSELQEINESVNCKELPRELVELQVKKEALRADLDKFAKKTVTFFIDLRNQVAKELKQMEEIRALAIKKQLEGDNKKQEALLKMLKEKKAE